MLLSRRSATAVGIADNRASGVDISRRWGLTVKLFAMFW